MNAIEDYLAKNYRVSVYRDEDADYVVEVDDLPGCVSHGSTPDETFNNLEEAKRAWMESRVALGLEIPEPRQTEDYSGRVLLRMPKGLHRRLALQSRAEGVSLNQYLVTLLSDASARRETSPGQAAQPTVVVYQPGGPLFRSSQYGCTPRLTNYEVGRQAFHQRFQAGMRAGLANAKVEIVEVQVRKPELQEEGIKEGAPYFPNA
jgi:antitoxin HicB